MSKKAAFSSGLMFVAFSVAGFAASGDYRLAQAAEKQDKTAVALLLKQHADVNAHEPGGGSALMWAAHWDDRNTVELLLSSGAKVNAADDHGVTPLARACENASVAVVEALLQAGANPNAEQTSGLTPLTIDAKSQNSSSPAITAFSGSN